MLVFCLLLLASMAFAETCDGPDLKATPKDKKQNNILLSNDNFLYALDRLYNKIPHHFHDTVDLRKSNFAAMALFLVNFVQFYGDRRYFPAQYEGAYDAALQELDPICGDPVQEAAPFRRLIDFLRVVISKRVADIQKLCQDEPSDKKCYRDVVAADKEQERRCPGYLAHAGFYDKLLKNVDKDENLSELVEVEFCSRGKVKSFLVKNRRKYESTLVRLAKLFADLVTVNFACISARGQDLVFFYGR